jgi:acyl-CoA synthetase (NDP forming)
MVTIAGEFVQVLVSIGCERVSAHVIDFVAQSVHDARLGGKLAREHASKQRMVVVVSSCSHAQVQKTPVLVKNNRKNGFTHLEAHQTARSSHVAVHPHMTRRLHDQSP